MNESKSQASTRSSKAPGWVVTLASGALWVGCAGAAPDRDAFVEDAGAADTSPSRLADKIVCTNCTVAECEWIETPTKPRLVCVCQSICTGNDVCVANKCTAPGTGAGTACSSSATCASGLTCTDGVCCHSASCGPCATCAMSGTGTCTPLAAGSSPIHACSGGTAACPDSLCDGFHTTCMPPNGEPCNITGCDTATGSNNLYYTGAGVCAVDGSCHGTAATCPALFACAAGACKTSCSSNADCATGATCHLSTHKCL